MRESEVSDWTRRAAMGAREDEKHAGRVETVEEQGKHPSSRNVSSRAGSGLRERETHLR